MQARATALTTSVRRRRRRPGRPDSAYIDALQAINQTYRNSVAAADAAFAAAFPGATTAAERAVVRATLELAIANAAVVRAAALGRSRTAPGSSVHDHDHDRRHDDDDHYLVTSSSPISALFLRDSALIVFA